MVFPIRSKEREQKTGTPYFFASSAATRSMARYWEQLQTMEKQTFTNIIYGKESPDAFDEFVENWHAQGGDEITQEINEWYQSIK